MATLFKRSTGIYYVVEIHDGKRTWRSTGATTRAEAQRFAKQPQSVPVQQTPAAAVTLAQFVEVFLLFAETNLAPTTVALYRAALKSFTRIISNKPLSSYVSLDLERYKALRSKEVSASKVNIDFLSPLAEEDSGAPLPPHSPAFGVMPCLRFPLSQLFFEPDSSISRPGASLCRQSSSYHRHQISRRQRE